ncbi:MAG TPA: hypothetical protein VL123_02400 [Candidatus Udaeobacter sp.]|nr:hypothetical protein [Candidatus Udaeobacter sp.]
MIEPAPEILEASRRWLAPLRSALGAEFLSAYLTGSVLTHGFHPRRSRINVLVIARSLGGGGLDAIVGALPRGGKPAFEPMFVTRSEIENSLDVFAIEWLDIQERHLLLEGEDVFAGLVIPHDALRLQCEHELRGRHLRLRQAYVLSHGRSDQLAATLRSAASGLATLFRTLLRLRGEVPPANSRVIERVAEIYRLDAAALLGPHRLRHSGHRPKGDEIDATFRRLLVELDRLIAAVDELAER